MAAPTTIPTSSVPTLTVDSTGITVPAFEDIYNGFVADYQSIYGTDVFLDPSSQDGQWIGILARVVSDCYQACAAVFNSFSPTTAQGAGLSSVVKLNGLSRHTQNYSSVVLTIVGTAGTEIANGLVGDNQNLGTQWLLPNPTIIPSGGTVNVTALSSTPGPVAAAPNTLTNILNPQNGWQTVNNATSASPGVAAETDAALRQRQAQSQSLPAMSQIEALQAAIAELPGVNRVLVYENKTSVQDANGIPGNSIAVVVDGGNSVDIATTIALKKAPGTGTYGSISTSVTDQRGVTSTINFFPLTYVPLNFSISINPLQGYTSAVGSEIVNSVVSFINSLGIGINSYLARLYTPVNLGSTGDGETFVVTQLQQGTAGNSLAAQDVAIAFNQATSTTVASVALVVL